MADVEGRFCWDDYDCGDIHVGCLSVVLVDSIYDLEVLEIGQERLWNWVFPDGGQWSVRAGEA